MTPPGWDRPAPPAPALVPGIIAGQWCRLSENSEKMMPPEAPSQECVGMTTQSRLGARLRPARFHLVFRVIPRT